MKLGGGEMSVKLDFITLHIEFPWSINVTEIIPIYMY